jgi:DNA-binding transcriptional LysR family regulator
VQLDPARYEMLQLGKETLAPYSACNKSGVPSYTMPGKAAQPLPYLSYSPNAYMARMADLALESAPKHAYLRKVYETDMAEGLKVMALEGHGVAFLPQSAVTRELKQKQLAPAGGAEWTVEMEVRIYRERQGGSPFLDRLWRHIAANLV